MLTHLYCFVFLFLPIFGNQQNVEFEKDILPIFRQHCFECHGDGNTEGELSLESVAALRRGGHTGNPLVAASLRDSELYLRITSLSDGYRMPKRGDSLKQREIDIIGKWIQQVATPANDQLFSAPGPEIAATSNAATRVTSAEASGSAQTNLPVDGVQQTQVVMLVVSTIFIVMLVCWLFYRMLVSGQNSGRKFSRTASKTIAFGAMLVGALSFLMIIALAYLYWQNGILVEENESLRAKLKSSQAVVIPPTVHVDASNLPVPPHPMHPPRLGGKYYRGNDERADGLFNGGFYRTATIDLQLVDSAGTQIKWGSSVNDDLSIQLTIQRSPNTTNELFSERVWKAVSLQHYSQSNPGPKQDFKFDVVKKDELWSVTIPLPKSDQWKDEGANGMVYLMYGVQPGPEKVPRPHFGIRYDLRAANGKVSGDSELWMGSLYTLGNRVLVPEKGKILLDRWFDWRSMPVIEGKGSSDRKLLGVEEHLGQ